MTGTELPGAEWVPIPKNCIAVPQPGIRRRPSLSERQLEPKIELVVLVFLNSYFIRKDAFPSFLLQFCIADFFKTLQSSLWFLLKSIYILQALVLR